LKRKSATGEILWQVISAPPSSLRRFQSGGGKKQDYLYNKKKKTEGRGQSDESKGAHVIAFVGLLRQGKGGGAAEEKVGERRSTMRALGHRQRASKKGSETFALKKGREYQAKQSGRK